jgi:hypothetical protein
VLEFSSPSDVVAAGNIVKPVLQALVLADRIYDDKGSGKKVIAGTFNRLIVLRHRDEPEVLPKGEASLVKIPAGGMQAGSPYAYLSLTEMRGEANLVLRYVQLKGLEHEAVFQTELQVRCEDPLRTVELVVPLPTLPPIPGVFALEVLCENELLGAHRVVVELAPT